MKIIFEDESKLVLRSLCCASLKDILLRSLGILGHRYNHRNGFFANIQAFGVLKHRCDYQNYLIYRISEPTNKIPPKIPGKKYEGGEIVSVDIGVSAYLLCQVTGFPAPAFRYWLIFEKKNLAVEMH